MQMYFNKIHAFLGFLKKNIKFSIEVIRCHDNSWHLLFPSMWISKQKFAGTEIDFVIFS